MPLQLSLSQSRHATGTRTGTPTRPPPHERPKPLHERIDDLIVATHRTKDLSLEDSQAGLIKALALLKEARVIVASRAVRMGPNKPKDTESMVSQIWDEIYQLKQQTTVSSRSNSSPARSWASIAALSNTTTAATTPTFGPTLPIKPTAQRLREVKIKFSDLMERSNVLGLSNKAILDDINKLFLAPRAVGIKRLPSGDLVVQTPTEDDRKSLIANQKWLTNLGSSGVVLLERFPVFVHAVRIANVDSDETKAIQYLKDENRTFFPDLSIVRAAFPKSALTGTKTYSSLIVELDSPEQANRLIRTGLCEGGEVKRCELFESGCKLTQCFNCQKYGHVARACRSPVRCSYCSKGHSSKDCSSQSDRASKRCSNCNGPHEAWARNCPTREREINRVRSVYAQKPQLYETTTKAAPPLTDFTGSTHSLGPKRGRPLGSTNKRLRTDSTDPRTGPIDRIFQSSPTPTLDTQIPSTQYPADNSWADAVIQSSDEATLSSSQW